MSSAWWYASRSAGLVAWALLAGSVLLGLLLSTKAMGRRVRPNWIQDLHRGLSGLAVAFVAVHVATAVADSYVHFGLADVTVPFASGWRTLAIAWGIVSMYLLVAVEATSLLKKHLPKGWWRKLHYLSFPLFITATTHGLTAGPDSATTAGIATVTVVSAAVVGLTVMRIRDEMAKATAEAAKVARPPAPVGSPAHQPTPASWVRPTVGHRSGHPF